MTYKVKNLKEGSRPHPKGYKSWIDYWEEMTGRSAVYCHEVNCFSKATDGAHVQLSSDYNDDSWYIVPLCHAHNTQFGETLSVVGPLVPVNPLNEIRW